MLLAVSSSQRASRVNLGKNLPFEMKSRFSLLLLVSSPSNSICIFSHRCPPLCRPPRFAILCRITQRKFLREVIGCTDTWKVLVLDDAATAIISAALTMYDIMEQRVTIVEKLSKSRQPFPEMDVVYLVSPNMKATNAIVDDFATRGRPKYGNVHIFYTDTIGADVIAAIQSNATLVSKIKTFKEVNIEYLVQESCAYHLNMPNTLAKLYGALPDPAYPALLGRKLATLCITLNEHPCIRYQASSAAAREIATSLHQTLVLYKRANPTVSFNGDDVHQDRERAQLLICDRTFDPLTPLMHEYTYQSMVYDLLPVEDGNVITYSTQTNRGETLEKKALLNEADELWVEFRHQHIAKVIETVKARLQEVLQTSASAALAKGSGGDMSMSEMSVAVKGLSEFQQSTAKINQHVDIAQRCMNTFTEQNLMNLSRAEQTIATGFDEDGNEVKGSRLVSMIADTLRATSSKDLKIRLLAIYFVAQRGATADDRRTLIQAARLTGSEQQVFVNFDRLCTATQTASAGAQGKAAGGFLSSIFRRTPQRHAPTPEGQYFDTRYVGQLKGLLEQMMNGELPTDKFLAMGPSLSSAGEAKAAARSVRKFGANTRWGKKEHTQFTGGRYMVSPVRPRIPRSNKFSCSFLRRNISVCS